MALRWVEQRLRGGFGLVSACRGQRVRAEAVDLVPSRASELAGEAPGLEPQGARGVEGGLGATARGDPGGWRVALRAQRLVPRGPWAKRTEAYPVAGGEPEPGDLHQPQLAQRSGAKT